MNATLAGTLMSELETTAKERGYENAALMLNEVSDEELREMFHFYLMYQATR